MAVNRRGGGAYRSFQEQAVLQAPPMLQLRVLLQVEVQVLQGKLNGYMGVSPDPIESPVTAISRATSIYDRRSPSCTSAYVIPPPGPPADRGYRDKTRTQTQHKR